jgi:hypothetical protein
MAIVFAFPKTHAWLTSAWSNGALLAILAGLVVTTGAALLNKRWLSALFHCGAAFIIVGGGLTAGYTKEGQVTLTDYTYAPFEYRQFLLEGERIALHSFEVPTYPNGMPRQYISHLVFPEGTKTVSVNHPLKRNGWTFYQMSYQKDPGYYGEPVFSTILTLRKDPGYPYTFCGYGLIIVAAFAFALRETCKRSKAQHQEGLA